MKGNVKDRNFIFTVDLNNFCIWLFIFLINSGIFPFSIKGNTLHLFTGTNKLLHFKTIKL